MIDNTILIGAIIVAVTQAIKFLSPVVRGVVTMIVAVLVGVITALLSTQIGLPHITVAQGILIALGAIGVHTVSAAFNTNNTPTV